MVEKKIDRSQLGNLGIGRRLSPEKPLSSRPTPAFPCPSFPDYLDAVRKAGSSVARSSRWSPKACRRGLGAAGLTGKLDARYRGRAECRSIAVKGVENRRRLLIRPQHRRKANAPTKSAQRAMTASQSSCQPCRRQYWAAISSGQPIVARFRRQADLLPSSLIAAPLDRCGGQGRRNRHQRAAMIPVSASAPCRVAEAMLACVLADHYLRQPAARPAKSDSINEMLENDHGI